MKCPNCNETDHEPSAKFCHVCGTSLEKREPKETPVKGYPQGYQHRKKILRLLLVFVLFVGTVIVSIIEWKINIPWGLVTIMLINSPAVFIPYAFVLEESFEHDKRIWQPYYKWLHFPVSIIDIILGLIILWHFQNFWALILDMVLWYSNYFMFGWKDWIE